MNSKHISVLGTTIVALMTIFNYESNSKFDNLTLSNVDALSQSIENPVNCNQIIGQDLGTRSVQQGKSVYSVSTIRMDCLGKGDLSCVSGTFDNWTLLYKFD